jgi:single-strand DNA-binding protein
MTSPITVVGNMTREPELRFTQSGRAVATVALAVSRRYQVNNEWQEETSFLDVIAWGTLAENVCSSLVKGARVIAQGRLAQRSYETADGTKRYVYEIVADALGPDLRYATATVERIERGAAAAGVAGDEPF